jgi:hypothetical protein
MDPTGGKLAPADAEVLVGVALTVDGNELVAKVDRDAAVPEDEMAAYIPAFRRRKVANKAFEII